jgi:hypothetical protein
MTFLNALLAFGATAFTIPLIIHLLNRSKYLTIDWGAMQFLETSVKVNSRKIQWKQLLLLLIRCLIPVLLALAMARPLLQAWKDSSDASPMSLAILIDDSLSMHTLATSGDRPGNESSRLQQAVSHARKVIEGLPTGSEVAWIWAGKPAQMEGEHQPASLLKMPFADRISTQSQKGEIASTMELSDAFTLATRWLDQGTNSKRHLLVISDFQASQWNASTQDLARELAGTFASRTVPIQWSLFQVAERRPSDTLAAMAKEPDIALVSMEGIPSHVVPNGKMSLTATLQNHSDSTAVVPVVLMEGLEEVERQSVSVAANATSSVRFAWSPGSTGDKVLKIYADWNDKTPQDHSMTRVIRVREPMSVLIVDGDRKQEAMQSESDFIRLALTPFSLLRGEAGDLFTTRVVTPGGWNAESLKNCEAVICCNVGDLSPDERKWLRTFVEQGGGLIFCLGDKVQAEKVNAWEGVSQGGLRIGKISPRTPWEGEVSLTSDAPFELSRASLDALRSGRFAARHELLLEESQVTIAAKFSDNLPYLARASIGQGRVYWMLASGDDDDSNLPAIPVYLPLMQKIVSTSIDWPPGWNEIAPGEAWVEQRNVFVEAGEKSTANLQATNLQATGQTAQAQQNVSVQLPDSLTREVSLRAQASDAVASGNIERIELGISRLEGVANAAQGDRRWSKVVVIPTKERRIELSRGLLSAEELEQFADNTQAKLYEDSGSWISQENSNAAGKEIWTWFWFGLLVLFLAEMVLQQKLNPRQTSRGIA